MLDLTKGFQERRILYSAFCACAGADVGMGSSESGKLSGLSREARAGMMTHLKTSRNVMISTSVAYVASSHPSFARPPGCWISISRTYETG